MKFHLKLSLPATEERITTFASNIAANDQDSVTVVFNWDADLDAEESMPTAAEICTAMRQINAATDKVVGFSFSGQDLTALGADGLVQIIKTCGEVGAINLAMDNTNLSVLGKPGLVKVFQAVRDASIQCLNVSGNNLGCLNNNLTPIFEKLQNSNVIHLDISNNNLGVINDLDNSAFWIIICSLKNIQLTYLNLQGNNLNLIKNELMYVMRRINLNCKHISEIDITNNNLDKLEFDEFADLFNAFFYPTPFMIANVFEQLVDELETKGGIILGIMAFLQDDVSTTMIEDARLILIRELLFRTNNGEIRVVLNSDEIIFLTTITANYLLLTEKNMDQKFQRNLLGIKKEYNTNAQDCEVRIERLEQQVNMLMQPSIMATVCQQGLSFLQWALQPLLKHFEDVNSVADVCVEGTRLMRTRFSA